MNSPGTKGRVFFLNVCDKEALSRLSSKDVWNNETQVPTTMFPDNNEHSLHSTRLNFGGSYIALPVCLDAY